MVVEGRQKVRTYDAAQSVIDAYVKDRGMDKDAVYTWLVVDEDYFDGCTFTRAQLRREVEWAWRNELRYRAVIGTVRIACHTTGILSEDKVKHIARTVALNADVMKIK